jgi:hypothetical protein
MLSNQADKKASESRMTIGDTRGLIQTPKIFLAYILLP